MVIVAAIASVIVGLKIQDDRLDRNYSVRVPKTTRPSPQVEQKAESSSTSETKKSVESSSVSEANASSANVITTYKTTDAFKQYKPRYFMTTIHPSNYGDRYSTDVYGNSVNNLPLVVLHETTNSIASAINTFKTPHSSDNNQVSYHTLIALDGTIIYLLTSDKRAFGAGNSVFESSLGKETVKTNANLPPSVNNFAYHISLETPPDSWGKSRQNYHSGYTDNQYKSLAWLLAQSNIPDERITTHKNVDRSGHRFDPRSFDFNKFLQILHTYRQPIDKMSERETSITEILRG
ncbi:N-acetylmuramoyl-L-alanine amidase [Myxosarcina sp. GI1]|uniref:N-acetylmuramoyl-L-alanine amidase n=1 Tax=Myxosarcina sp. GI1 TaxID=1541065 RepID=UPI00068E9CBA|nr:peptidoglycan recognition family protein [Myxosarcina sp. GI1]